MRIMKTLTSAWTAEYGVVHTHRNREVVGGSKAEDHMSRCAVKDVYELKMYTQEPAIHCPEMSYSEESDDYGQPSVETKKTVKKASPTKSKAKATGSHTGRSEVVGNTQVLIGQTPKGIRMSQFKDMADTLGYSTVEDLAVAVLVGQPQEILEEVYTQQNPGLKEVVQSLGPSQQTTQQSERVAKRPGRPKKPPEPQKKRSVKRRRRPVYSDMSDSDTDPAETAPSQTSPVSSGSDTEIDDDALKPKSKEKREKQGVKEASKEKQRVTETTDKDERFKERTGKHKIEAVIEQADKSGNDMNIVNTPKKKEHKTAAESIESLVNEMFSSPEKTPKTEVSTRKQTVSQKVPSKSPKRRSLIGDGKTEKGRNPTTKNKDMNETFAFLDSVFFD